MANHKSALKRARQSAKKHERNTAIKASTKTALKKAMTAIETAKDKKAAMAALALVQKALGSAASKGTIPKSRVSRKTSRIATKINEKFA